MVDNNNGQPSYVTSDLCKSHRKTGDLRMTHIERNIVEIKEILGSSFKWIVAGVGFIITASITIIANNAMHMIIG